jgi:hypothetical protein
MKMSKLLALLIFNTGLCSSTAFAAKDSTQTAMELGSVLASEELCGLTYDQKEIENFIVDHIDENDMGFSSTLETMTMGSKFQFENLSTSQRTARCVQIRRVAKKFGFTK